VEKENSVYSDMVKSSFFLPGWVAWCIIVLFTFVQFLRDKIMVRVGGGWDTLDHFLLKHDPCRVKGKLIEGFCCIEQASQKFNSPSFRFPSTIIVVQVCVLLEYFLHIVLRTDHRLAS